MRFTITCVLLTVLILAGSCRKDGRTEKKVEPRDFLSGKNYEKLVVELQYVNGYDPTQEAITNLQNFLQQYLNKPGGITIVHHGISSPGKSAYSLDDIREIEKNNRKEYTKRNTLALYCFFADAEFSGNSGSAKVLGVAYGNTSLAIFEKTVRDYSGGVTQPPRSMLESTVLHHEAGHILGLVNNGTEMQLSHQDVANGKHCNNKNCLMYYTAETTDIVANLLGGSIPTLDGNCVNDLRGNGGK